MGSLLSALGSYLDARAHGGDITATSRLHEGSVFTVTLPSSG